MTASVWSESYLSITASKLDSITDGSMAPSNSKSKEKESGLKNLKHAQKFVPILKVNKKICKSSTAKHSRTGLF